MMRTSGVALVSVVVGGLFVGLLAVTSVAVALVPLGACCFTNGDCEDLISEQCVTQAGTFIGDGTSCEEVDCGVPVAVPVLSIVGLVVMFGALGSLGIYGLLRRRRR